MASKYPLILALQMLMIIIDIGFNSMFVLLFGNNIVLLMISIIQDALIVMSALVLIISFSSTYVFQAGLITLLLVRFSASLLAAVIYLILTITFHYIVLTIRWNDPQALIFHSLPLLTLCMAQKYAAVLYYSSFKRAALLLSDPKYHGDTEWLRNKIRNSS